MVIQPIASEDVRDVSTFLNKHLNASIPVHEWLLSFQQQWCANPPDLGAKMLVDGQLVGVFPAIYSDQTIDGRVERICNPHSWCVLPEHRRQSIGLLLMLLRQPGAHFAMLSPNKRVAEIFRSLAFKDMGHDVCIIACMPTREGRRNQEKIATGPAAILAALPESTRREYTAHRNIRWLRAVAIGPVGSSCLILYKPMQWKRMRGARLLGISDIALFNRNLDLIRHYFAVQEFMAFMRIESRFLARRPRLSIVTRLTEIKLYKSPTLVPGQIRDVYTELVALDI